MVLLARSLPDDYQVRVFSLGDGPYVDVLRTAGIDVRIDRRKWRHDVSPALRLRQDMIRWRPDVVHSWGWMSTAAAIIPCRMLGVPLVDGTIRRGNLPPTLAGFKRFLVSRADAVIANSEAGVVAFNLRRPGVFVVHNGFEAERLPQEHDGPVRAWGAVAEVVMAARMVREKDFDTLIEAAEALHHSGNEMRLTLTGSGPERERVIARCGDLLDLGLVRIVDCGMEVMPVLATADIGVLLTDPRYLAEGLS